MGKIFNKGLDKEDKKEGLLKRLKNIETNQKSNNNNNDKSELSDTRSESSSYTSLTSDHKTQISFEYLKDNKDEIFEGYPNIFDSNLKVFFNYIASKEKRNIDYNLLSKQILLPSGNVFSFFGKVW